MEKDELDGKEENVNSGSESEDLGDNGNLTRASEYLRQQFVETFQDLDRLNATPNPYGGAYTWITRIQRVEAVMQELGIGQGQGEAHSTIVSNAGLQFQITCEDVKECFGLKVTTFDSNRSRVRKLRKVWNGLGDNREMWENDPEAVRDRRTFQVLQECFRVEGGMLPSRHQHHLLANASQRSAVNMAMAPILKDCTVLKDKYMIMWD